MALRVISPATASVERDSEAIPAIKLLPPNSPPEILILRPLTLILPPPAALTFTSTPLVKVTSALATPSGKLIESIPKSSPDCCRLKLTCPNSATPPNSILAPGAVISAPAILTLPPKSTKASPLFTWRLLALTAISPGLLPKVKPIGILIVSIGG